jgi:hypothetical protein
MVDSADGAADVTLAPDLQMEMEYCYYVQLSVGDNGVEQTKEQTQRFSWISAETLERNRLHLEQSISHVVTYSTYYEYY